VERRHITFLFLAASMLIAFNLMNSQKPEEEQDPQNQQVVGNDEGEAPVIGGESIDGVDGKQSADRSFVTLGSVDPADGYEMLVTFDSKGAAVHRVELSNPGYQSFEHTDDGGYLGQLAFDEADQKGVLIRAVGKGTPANKAGMQVGDIIVSVAGTSVRTVAEFSEAMKSTQPGETVTIGIERTTEGADTSEQKSLTVDLHRHPIEIIRPEVTLIEGVGLEADQTKHHPPSFLTKLLQIDNQSSRDWTKKLAGVPSLMESVWEAKQIADDEVHFELFVPISADAPEGEGLLVVKKFKVAKIDTGANGFHIDYTLEIENKTQAVRRVAYRQMGPNGLPLEGWWYANKIGRDWGGAGMRDVTWESADGSRFQMFTVSELVDQAEKEGAIPELPLYDVKQTVETEYVGVDALYFNCSMLLKPDESVPGINLAQATGFPVGPIDEEQERLTNCTFSVDTLAYLIQPDEKVTQSYQIFAGPKKTEVLKHYGLSKVEYYGWFSYVSQVLLYILHGIHAVVPNYAFAIILLTIAVRAAMHPISRKQAKNMQIQAALAPEIKRISDQYKDKPEERLKAQQELFKKHNFNPVGGCGLMFLQLPIFLGLYRGLAVDFELRQAPFFPGISWCSNLAAPDQLWYWADSVPEFITSPPGIFGLYLGPYLNVLPLFTVVLFLIQQKMFMPPPQDEQQAMQQKMMTFMMFFMGIIFFKVPSGLCIYFITSSIWGIVERKMLPKPKIKVAAITDSKPEEQKRQPRKAPSNKKKK